MSETRRRSKQGFPLFRTILIIGIVGGVLIGGGLLSFFTDQQSRRTPLEVELYPGAQPWGESPNNTSTSRTIYYQVAGVSPDTIAVFYQQKMVEHYGAGQESCVRLPTQGEFPDVDVTAGEVPFFFKCLFDRSGLGSSQYTEVIIMPGMYNADPFLNTEGASVVQYNQTWQP